MFQLGAARGIQWSRVLKIRNSKSNMQIDLLPPDKKAEKH